MDGKVHHDVQHAAWEYLGYHQYHILKGVGGHHSAKVMNPHDIHNIYIFIQSYSDKINLVFYDHACFAAY